MDFGRQLSMLALVTILPLQALAQSSPDLATLSAAATGGTTAEAAPAYPDLSGTWGLRVVQSSISRVPVVGDVSSSTISYMLTEVEQNGEQLTLRSTVCGIDVESSSRMVRTVIPDAFVAAIDAQEVEARLASSSSGWIVEDWQTVDVLGARLSNPLDEDLPSDEDDWRVMDPDRDGNPGVTVRVRGLVDGEIYLVQRGASEWITSRVEQDSIVGHVNWWSEQQILGASSVFLQSQPPTEPDPDRDANRFELVRLAPSTTCETVTDSAEDLFGSD